MDRKRKKLPLARLLLNAFRWFDQSLLASLEAQDQPKLNHSQSLVMARMPGDSGIRISELARRVGISRQAAQKRVAELEQLGLVTTEVDSTNISAKLVRLTDDGRVNVQQALATFEAIEAELVKRIGKTNYAQLVAAVSKDWGQPFVVDNVGSRRSSKRKRPRT